MPRSPNAPPRQPLLPNTQSREFVGDIGELSDRIDEINTNIEAVMRLVDSSQKIVRE